MKYGEKAKLCCMNADILIMYIITNGVYIDFVKDVGTRFHTSNYELEIRLPGGKLKNIIESVKDEWGVEIMIVFAALRPKTYIYSIANGGENKKSKMQKNKSGQMKS